MIFINLQSFIHHLENLSETNITTSSQLFAQLVACCIGMAEVMSSRPYFHLNLNSVFNCDDCFHIGDKHVVSQSELRILDFSLLRCF